MITLSEDYKHEKALTLQKPSRFFLLFQIQTGVFMLGILPGTTLALVWAWGLATRALKECQCNLGMKPRTGTLYRTHPKHIFKSLRFLCEALASEDFFPLTTVCF